MAAWANPKISHFSTTTVAAALIRTPVAPPAPLIRKFRRMTMPPAALTLTPLTPGEARIAATWPPPPSRVIDLVIVTVPKPPGSSASISPPVAVFEMAPGQVLHGAVRLHGLASSPTPETQVRVACACAGAVATPPTKSAPRSADKRVDFVIMKTPQGLAVLGVQL